MGETVALVPILLIAVLCGVAGQTPGLQDVWRSGPILEAVQTAYVFPDSKSYVDLPLNTEPGQVEAAFNGLPRLANGSVDRPALVAFVNQYFGDPGSDLEEYVPSDFQQSPPGFLPNVTDPAVRQWALDVHGLWLNLSRRVNDSVLTNPERHSLLPLPNNFVVPGSRFREVYYWDSYWVIKGLLVSQMDQTALSIVGNLLYLLKTYGFVPNGARTYYLNRSQPPLLSQMVKAVYEATSDQNLLMTALPLLIREHSYWTSGMKAVNVSAGNQTYQLSRYYANWTLPRPESWREDVALAANLTDQQAAQLWRNVASAAESGWDFSSRWFADGLTMSTIRTTLTISADLNAYLYQMEGNIADFAMLLGNRSIADEFRGYANQRQLAIQDLMWDGSSGQWRDLMINGSNPDGSMTVTQNPNTYASNFIPLWAGLANPGSLQAQAVVSALQASGIVMQAGISTSLYNTTQQWDFPNAWPPLVSMIVEGLEMYGGVQGQNLAAQLAHTWLLTNYVSYVQLGDKMVEKFNAQTVGVAGGGGEYNVQVGFGWTNGVMLELLNTYGYASNLQADYQNAVQNLAQNTGVAA
jgi:alpha,alpha-trehalase